MPLLFSYGTLQQDDVQRATFGRLLTGQRDTLPGYLQEIVFYCLLHDLGPLVAVVTRRIP